MALDKQLVSKRRDLVTLQEEMQIATLEPKEAHARFVARVNDFKLSTKSTDERIVQGREDTERLKQQLVDLSSNTQAEGDNGDAAKFELLKKRDQEMTAFIDKFDPVSRPFLYLV